MTQPDKDKFVWHAEHFDRVPAASLTDRQRARIAQVRAELAARARAVLRRKR